MADPFSICVIQAGLEAAAEEMFEVLRKTAMSPIIYEVLDVGTGVTDPKGALVSSGAGIPSFVGVLDKAVVAILEKEGDAIKEGDIFIVNDPNFGGVTHLNDVVVAEPVYYHGECVAWVASIAHWGDIGGRTPGSMAVDVTEVFAEGLRIPIARLFAIGRQNKALFDIICANSRLPDFVSGDLWAQVSAGRKAAEVIRDLCDRYGTDLLKQAIAEAREIGLSRALKGIASLPKGCFEIEEPQDDGTSWKIGIKISQDRFVVDLRELPDQADGPYNTSRDGAVVACQVFFKALTDPERFANAGSFQPLDVLTRPGSIFDPGPTAAHGYYFENRMRLIDAMWHCLAQAIPGRLPAGHFASIFGTVITGVHPDTGRSFAMVEPQMGGWGATTDRPGITAMYSTNHGDTFNCPVEIAEARYGFEVVTKTLNLAPQTPTANRGGHGMTTRYRMRAQATLSVGYSHDKVPVWSIGDTRSGGLNRMRIHRTDGTSQTERFVSGQRLDAGDELEIVTAFGGSSSQGFVSNF